MHENSHIESWIAAMLTGSGLPVERRAEVADELRGHLEQRITAYRDTGLPEEQAVERALTDFGSPRVIRGQLRRQQRALDRRDALLELRRCIWLLVAVCGLLAAAAAIFSPGPVPRLTRLPAGACLFTGLLPIASVPAYLASLLECKVKHRLPREEHQFIRSWLRWMAVVALFLAGTLSLGPFLIGIGGYIGQDSLFQLIPYQIGVAALESPIRSFVVPFFMVLGCALLITLYERSRCVDGQTTPVGD